MLYDPELHEPLTDRVWDEAWVRDAIAGIVADTVAAYDPDDFWPTTEYDLGGFPPPLMEVYTGAAGIAWALARVGSPVDAARIHERYRAAPTEIPESGLPPRQWRSSLLTSETGIAFVAYAQAPSREVDDILLDLVRANLGNETNELMWGVPGTLLVARAMHARTGDARWDEVMRESAADVRAARDDDGWWTVRLSGTAGRVLGPVHGFVGNVRALGGDDAACDLLRESAQREGDHVNWPPDIGSKKRRLQWCHGAPGIITTAASYLDEDLVMGGAQLTWDAGPGDSQEKGAGICHGTAGNGYGLLKAFERLQDELWLERARAFAVHALEQARALPPRHSLFNGAIGAAVFAQDCIDARPCYPVLDDFV